MQFTGCHQPVQRSRSPENAIDLAGIMVIRCVMRRAWTHKFQSSGLIPYSVPIAYRPKQHEDEVLLISSNQKDIKSQFAANATSQQLLTVTILKLFQVQLQMHLPLLL